MTDLFMGAAIATVIAVASTAWKRARHYEEYVQMGWMDWCGHYALVGIAVILASGAFGWMPLTAAGVLLLVPLYPIALLGILGKLDDTVTDILRAIRRR